jgi:hypothetical protein
MTDVIHDSEPIQRRYYYIKTYRQWIGKSDPSGFGKQTVWSDNYGWLAESRQKDQKYGHKVSKIVVSAH